MKYSNNYIFYPINNELVKAVDHYKDLSNDQDLSDNALDVSNAVQDNFLHARGNFEQHRFSANILESAKTVFESTLTELLREKSPLEWASIQNSLGNILGALGQQQMDVALYESSIKAFQYALEEFTQEGTPSEWAVSQYNFGNAFQALGRLQADSKLLQKSIDAYTDALLVCKRSETPDEWAVTMFQLGMSFYEHGKLLKGSRTFEKSVVAFNNALAGYDADNHALALAATHNNRGVVLHNLAELEKNVEGLKEAIRSYETAETVCLEQQQPFHLTVLCKVNKATARAVLAELTADAILADEVADDFEVILECFPHALQPLCQKHCEAEMDKARAMHKSLSSN